MEPANAYFFNSGPIHVHAPVLSVPETVDLANQFENPL